MLKPPEASVSTVRSAPVSIFFADTDAFGTTAPCGSRTVPRIVPVMFWAADFWTFASKHTMHKRTKMSILGLFPVMQPSVGRGFALSLELRLPVDSKNKWALAVGQEIGRASCRE